MQRRANKLDLVDGLGFVALVYRLLPTRSSPVFLSLVAGRLARATGFRVAAVLAMLGKQGFQEHYSIRSRWQDLLAVALIIDPSIVTAGCIPELSPQSFAGHSLEDVLISTRAFGEDATGVILGAIGAAEAERLLDLYHSGEAFTWYAPWYAAQIKKMLKKEYAVRAALR